MRRNKSKKIIIGLSVIGLIAAATMAYFYYMPHRNVVESSSDYQMTATTLVNEYLSDATSANNKYLNEEGESKIIAVQGKVASVTIDMNDQQVILLKADDAQAGVSCTFTSETNSQASTLAIGNEITIKGVIRSGAAYDEDLEMYEDVILEKCSIK